MRISKISVTGLFGMFDHEIPLNQGSRITIIHGPNGVGKTVLMQLVQSLFLCDYDFLDHIPFEQFRIDFESGNFATVEKSDSGDASEGKTTLLVVYKDNRDEEIDSFTIRVASDDFFNSLVKRIHPEYFHASLHGETKIIQYWIANDGKYTDLRYITDKYDYLQPLSKQDMLRRNPEIHEEACGGVPDWFATVQQDTLPNLIPMARLESTNWGLNFWVSLRLNRDRLNEDDGKYSVPSRPDSVSEIQSKLNYNSRLMAKISYQEEIEDIQTELDERWDIASKTVIDLLEERILYLKEQLKEENKDIENRAGDLYCGLLNQRILFKFLELDVEEGIKAHLDDGSDVPLSTLSSGERQLLVLYYRLLFQTNPNTLVMIDEPELSMNVVWQRNFLKDLQRIVELREFDVLIATHSPMIIHDKWDWVVHLGEKVDD